MDFFLFHGRIWQGNGQFAPALLLRNGRITAVGDTAELRQRAGGCQFVDCGGRTVIPGFYDACLCLAAASSPLPTGQEGLKAAVQTAMTACTRLAKKGGRLFWRAEDCDPHRSALDDLWPHSPLMLEDVCAQRAWANSKGLELLEKHGLPQNLACHAAFEKGRPTGQLSGPACGYLASLLPPQNPRQISQILQTALEACGRAGITTVHSFDLGLWLKERDLPVVRQLLCRVPLPRIRFFARQFRGSDDLFCGQITLPEALSRAQWQPGQPVLPCPDGPALDRILSQVQTHPLPQENARRMTLLGASCTCPDQLRQLGRLQMGIIGFPQRLEHTLTACMGQPGCDGGTCCAFRTLGKLGAHMAFGGLDSLQPWLGIQKAVCRRDKEALTLEDALTAATAGAAWTGFDDDLTGRLAPGYRADLQVLSDDPFARPADGLHTLRPVLVMAGGQVLHREI